MRIIFAVAAMALLSGCAMGDRMQSLAPGMSQAQVVAKLGKPDGYRSEGNVSVLQYTNQVISISSPDRADYEVTLTDGRVTSYGPSEVRQNRSEVTPVLLMGL